MQRLECLREPKIILDANIEVIESCPKCHETLTLVVRSGFVIKYFRRTEIFAPQGSIPPEAVLLMYLFTTSYTWVFIISAEVLKHG